KVKLKWSSSDPNVAKVDNGKVKALAEGKTTITLTTEDGRISASTMVTVGTPASTKLNNLYFSKDVYNVQKGDTIRLSIKGSPSDFDLDTLSLYYMTEDENIATVTQDGEVTGEEIGKTVVYVSTTDSKYSAEAVINVLDDLVPVEDVYIDTRGEQFDGSTLEVFEDQSFSLKAIVSPDDATEDGVKWSTSDRHVVAVDDEEYGDFEVKGKVGDTAKITVTTVDGGKTDTIKVKIVEGTAVPVKITGIDIVDSDLELAVGQDTKLSVNITPSNATNKTLSWSSSNGSVASVTSSGVVKAIAEGTTTIKASASDGSGWTDSINVTVKKATTNIKVESVSITGASEVAVGSTINLEATVSPDNATNKNVAWKSSNTAVAEVSSDGTVTGVKEGAVNITATAKDGSGKSATYKVTVVKAAPVNVPVTGISISGPSKVTVGESINLSANIEPSNATDKSVTWSSSDKGIATVSGGKVTGVTAGTVTIIAKSNGLSSTIEITVEAAAEEPVPDEPNDNTKPDDGTSGGETPAGDDTEGGDSGETPSPEDETTPDAGNGEDSGTTEETGKTVEEEKTEGPAQSGEQTEGEPAV
ncbi:MAG: Ig-like domain-containing protein, partial [Eubacteriales bacterium]|nr:Ig-like domain-containing protein [Eubacteriales bacterium]